MADIVATHARHGDTEGVVLAKGVAMAVLFSASMICGIVPLFLAKKFKWIKPDEAGDLKSKNKVVITLLSFGGGVLLSTTFLHLVPEVDHNIEDLVCNGLMKELDFSLSALLMCSGFFIMYLVEELVHMYIHSREKRNAQVQPLVRNLSLRRSRRSSEENGDKSVTNSTADLIDQDSMKKKDAEHNSHPHGHSHMPTAATDDVTSALRGLLIVLALSIHELFEGLAVGLESSSSHVWYMLGAVSAHKLVIAFCIGVELIATRTKTWLAVAYITTFAIVSPMGIGIGLLLVGGEGATAAGVYSVVLQGLASGTLLYVIFFEIWKNDRTGIVQYFSALIGFALMFGLQLLSNGLMKELDFSLSALLMCSGFFIMYLVEELVHMYIHSREKRNAQVQPLVRNLSLRRSRRSSEENGDKSVTNSTADLIDQDSMKKKDAEHNSHPHGHSHMPTAATDDVTSALRGLLIVLALSIHELFEGLAVGLESSSSHVWYMLGAVSAHKLVIAFCIGVELIATRTKTWLAVAYITTFAIVSPMGIGIGLLLVGGEGATAAGVYSVVLQGLASGTLLYVIFFEIWKNDRTGIVQYFSALIGFALMFGLQLLSNGLMKELDFSLSALLMCSGFFIMYLVEELVHMYIHSREKRNAQVQPLVRNLSLRRSRRSSEENGDKSVTNSTADLIDQDSMKKKDAEHNSHPHGHSHMPTAATDDVTSALRGLLIVLALSIHELFEGLAVGLESSSSHVWYMLGAVSAHKLVIAFCIGVELIATRTKTWLAVAYITTFAIVSPMGIGIGLLLVGGEGATAAGVYSVVLQGLASGTLLYVIFFEIWKNDRTGIVQYFSALIGFALMFGLQLLTGHAHTHSHGVCVTDDHDHGHSHNH